MTFTKNDAPILIVMGQSNAHGHGTRLKEEEQIRKPLSHVLGLSREKNQSYDLKDVEWSPFCTEGMNLGETQDHTCCLAGEFARQWEARAEELKLPDLYLIQISIGGQGIHKKENGGWNMWYPGRERILIPGSLDDVNISLYPLAVTVLALAVRNLKNSGKNPVILGLHWNQWETEVDTAGESMACAEENYKAVFAGFREALSIPCPICLYRPLSRIYADENARLQIDKLFQGFVKEQENFYLVDISTSPLWDENAPDNGIFQEDHVHYNKEAQRWFAQWQWTVLSRLPGRLETYS